MKIFTIYIDKIFIDDTIYRIIQYHVYFFLRTYIILDRCNIITALQFDKLLQKMK